MSKESSAGGCAEQPPCAYASEVLDALPCTNAALRRATRRLAYLYDEALECVGLKATQVALLGAVDQLTNRHTALGPTLQDVAGALTIQTSALTHALRPLVRDGFVALVPDAIDKRSKRAVLSAQGKLRLKQAVAAWSTVNHRVDDVLGPSSAAALRALVDTIASDGFLRSYRALGECPKTDPTASVSAGGDRQANSAW